MDQTAVNGAQLFYFEDFNITNTWDQGLINGAPYLCSVLIGCWTSPVLNKYFGRRGTIWISCFVSVASGAWQGATFDKWQLFASRFVGGFAIGAKSSTTPAYAMADVDCFRYYARIRRICCILPCASRRLPWLELEIDARLYQYSVRLLHI
jgi:MFS family permease